MTKVYEIDTWRNRDDLNRVAIEAAKKYNGNKFTVAIGEWGTVTYLVFAESKQQAKEMAVQEYKNASVKANNDHKIKIRDVTNSKKYN